MKDIVLRSITGLIFISLVIGSILFSSHTNGFSFGFLFLLFTILGTVEFYQLLKKQKIYPQTTIGTILSISIFTINFLFAFRFFENSTIFLLLFPIITSIFIFELYRKQKQPFLNIAYTFLAPVFIGIPFAILNYLVANFNGQEIVHTPNILVGFFIILWIYDSGAYVFGVSFGKHRLFERISPKKSWEGFIGGSIVAISAANVISVFFTELRLFDWLIISAIIIVFGTFGDLVESLLKRELNIKDSGNILPGHGGILDRFDGIFLSVPIIFAYLQIVRIDI
ncbi:MAG: phosphatidate cytidylyltransferase [Bacteroidetes bacterium]|nr:phosphatidate cytidylyltransferase [Bacteroidota bacterium]MBT6686316.1 phosphatidate cytidylyltransferase [Bacteroidota bacterium]MBT7142149.1 phosphatidate cytidylyltransferase [Bacteroidota bacterium]MBT7490496.1 phosphatidate cytidylyltransferase [Bacteroidota bacterium]